LKETKKTKEAKERKELKEAKERKELKEAKERKEFMKNDGDFAIYKIINSRKHQYRGKSSGFGGWEYIPTGLFHSMKCVSFFGSIPITVFTKKRS
jgi:hypothetical protein